MGIHLPGTRNGQIVRLVSCLRILSRRDIVFVRQEGFLALFKTPEDDSR